MNVSSLWDGDNFDFFKDSYNEFSSHVLFLIASSFIGLCGNMLLCYVIAFNKHMHTNTNYYLLSLAVSDGLILATYLCDSFYHKFESNVKYEESIVHLIYKFIGVLTCKSSVTTSVALTVDRYIAVCHPFLARTWFNKRRTVIIIASIWIVNSPYSLGITMCISICYFKTGMFCSRVYPLFSVESNTFIFFFTPMTCFVILYSLIIFKICKSGKIYIQTNNGNKTRVATNSKSIRMSVAIVLEFFICWGPINLMSLIHKYYSPFRAYEKKDVLIYLANLMYMSSTVLNPIVYCIISNKFRKSFKDVLCSRKI